MQSKNLLINPRSMIQEGYTPPPLGLMHISAMDANTQIADLAANREADVAVVIKQHSPKIVGVPVYTIGRHESIRILKIAKEFGAITVAGGPHVTLMFEQMAKAYPFIDYLVVGDGEKAWELITRGVNNIPRIVDIRVDDLSKLPCPSWHLINLMNYPPWGFGIHRGNDLSRLPRCPIIFGRGCHGSCAFCSTWKVNGKYRHYSMEWMEYLLSVLWANGARHLGWQDDCLTADPQATFELCKILQKYGFSSFGTTRVDRINRELAKAMAVAGFYELTFGIESGSPAILKAMGKNTDIEKAIEARNACGEAGISFTALMMDGYPGETAETRMETQNFLQRLMPNKICSLGQTLVLPGTKIYEQYKEAGKVTDEFWLGEEMYLRA